MDWKTKLTALKQKFSTSEEPLDDATAKSILDKAEAHDELKSKVDASQKEIETLKAQLAEKEKLVNDEKQNQAEASYNAYMKELEDEKLITPAMKTTMEFVKTMTDEQRKDFKASLVARGKAYNDKPNDLKPETSGAPKITFDRPTQRAIEIAMKHNSGQAMIESEILTKASQMVSEDKNMSLKKAIRQIYEMQ